MAQTDADKAAGIMRFTFGSEQAQCRTLPNAPAQRWFREYRDRITDLARDLPRLSTDKPERGEQMLDVAFGLTRVAIEAIKAWDRADELPSAEWLAENATTSQLQIAIDDMKAEAAGPFAQEAVTMAMLQLVAESRPPSSTNGQSPAGDEIPATSTKRSPRRR